MKADIKVRRMKRNDVSIISNAFKEQGWNKPEKQYIEYFQDQEAGERTVLIAEHDNSFAGYITILWDSDDLYFRHRNIPEIKDFNVLIKYRKQGIGSCLMDEAETIVFEKSGAVGLSVGLISDYGSAQRMYVKRGYIPTGEGLKVSERIVGYSENVVADDDLVLSFTKNKSL